MSSAIEKNTQANVMNPPNAITVARILLVPVFVVALLCPWPDWMGIADSVGPYQSIIAAVIFIIISCTDWLDGYLARSRDMVTDFGKLMDPLADKILVAAALISLVELDALPTWVVLVILAREFIISGVRMMAATKGTVIAASYIGKSKTVFQMIAIVLFTIKDSPALENIVSIMPIDIDVFCWITMGIALILTIVSLIDYLVKARDVIGLGSSDVSETTTEVDGSSTLPATDEELHELACKVIEEAIAAHMTIGTAESLTGGLISATLTSVAGSSEVVRGGVASYTNGVKHDVLDVSDETLNTEGAVSADTACQMAQGARTRLSCDIAVSVTGIAGPGGAEPGKPVGTVFMGVSNARGTTATRFQFEGDRNNVRRATVHQALIAFLNELDSASQGE